MPTGALDGGQQQVVRVRLLDDRLIVLHALRRALDAVPGVEVMGASSDPSDLPRPLPDDEVLLTSASRRWHTRQVSVEGVDLGDSHALRLVLTSDEVGGRAAATDLPTLTPLEAAALGSAAAGMSATAAARSWGTSVKSVENARGRAKDKLGAVNIAEAVHLAQLTDDEHTPPPDRSAHPGGAVDRAD